MAPECAENIPVTSSIALWGILAGQHRVPLVRARVPPLLRDWGSRRLTIRHVDGSEKMDLGSDRMDLDDGSVGLYIQLCHLVERTTGIANLSLIFV